MKPKRKEAANGKTASKLCRVESGRASGNGLPFDLNVFGPSAASAKSANMPASRRMTGSGGRSPLSLRRMTAASRILNARGVSHGGVRAHGLIAPVYLFHGSMPCGEPSGSPFPKTRYFLHPHGVALPVGRLGGSRQSVLGVSHE